MSKNGSNYYAVAIGHRPGIYRSWPECSQQVRGCRGARFKKFKTEREALEFIEQNRGRVQSGKIVSNSMNSTEQLQLPASSSTDVRNLGQVNDTSETSDWNNAPVVYTDGSCLRNGRTGSKAGYGVYWGENHPENVSAPLLSGNQTNNRAELTAVIVALRSAVKRRLQSVIVRTDSQLLIKTMNEWIKIWRRNGWRTATGGDVKNRDLIVQLDGLLQKIRVRFEHVAGHAGIFGNERADQLARDGATNRNDRYGF